MKFYAPIFSVLLLASCSHVNQTASVGTPDRSIAQVSRRIAEEFLQQASKFGDNAVQKSASEMESALLKEIKSNPSRFGLSDQAAKDLKRLDDVKSERVMAEILSEAPSILKFTPKMKSASMATLADNASLASQVSLKSVDVSKVSLSVSEQTGLGREISLRLKHFKSDLVQRKIASESQAAKIYADLFQAAKDLSAKAKGDPAQLLLARQIIDYSTAISQKTGKSFLGKGGCMKINGKAVLENKAEIAYKTLGDVESQGLKNYDEIGEALQKNHSEVTNRTKKESCEAIRALTSGKACGNVYHPSLSPAGC